MALKKQKWSLSGLSVELGIDRRTLAKRLDGLEPCSADKRAKYYYMESVHKHLIKAVQSVQGEEATKVRQEKTKLEMMEIELGLLKDEVIYVDELEDYLFPMISNIRAKLLGLSRIAPKLATTNDIIKLEEMLSKTAKEILMDLSEYDPKQSHNRANNRKKRKVI